MDHIIIENRLIVVSIYGKHYSFILQSIEPSNLPIFKITPYSTFIFELPKISTIQNNNHSEMNEVGGLENQLEILSVNNNFCLFI